SYMTREFILSPFGPQDVPGQIEKDETWTGPTTLFSVDISCQGVEETETEYLLPGCRYFKPETQLVNDGKTYSTLYVGYNNADGYADFYLSANCTSNASHTFLIRWAKNNWNVSTTTAINETTLYCEPSYYQQEVNATISLPDRAVVDVSPVGEKKPI